MSSPFTAQLPEANLETREKIFAGEIFLTEANSTSRTLIRSVRDLIAEKLGVEDIRTRPTFTSPTRRSSSAWES